MQRRPCESWPRPSSVHLRPCFWQEPFPEHHFVGLYLVQRKSVSRTFKGTHIPGKLTSLGGTRSSVQHPGIFPVGPAPSHWQCGQPKGPRVGRGPMPQQPQPRTTQRFERTRYRVSTHRPDGYRVPGVTHLWFHIHLGPPGHVPS